MKRETIIIIRPGDRHAIINTSSVREFKRLIKLGYEPCFLTIASSLLDVVAGRQVVFQVPKNAVVFEAS